MRYLPTSHERIPPVEIPPSPDKDVWLPRATEGITLRSDCSVLIVDQSEESRVVLTTALERRGIRTFTADRVDDGLELARRYSPDLVVFDLETPGGVAEDAEAALNAIADQRSLIALGSVHSHRAPLCGGEFVRKPYHYAPLIRKIEELLDRVAGQRYARCA